MYTPVVLDGKCSLGVGSFFALNSIIGAIALLLFGSLFVRLIGRFWVKLLLDESLARSHPHVTSRS